MKTKECEVHFNVARYEHQRKLAENESTRSRTLTAQVNTFSQTETELRSQLNIYVEKFKQVSGDFNYHSVSYLFVFISNQYPWGNCELCVKAVAEFFTKICNLRSKTHSTIRTTYS